MGKSVSYFTQQNELPFIKEQFTVFNSVHSLVLQDILRRVDLSFKHFFRRIKQGENPGFPRFKGKDRFNSICYTQSGFKIIGNRVQLSKIGSVKIKLHRKVEGTIKTCSIKKQGNQWYVIFTAEQNIIVPKKAVSNAVGIDLGLENFAVLSDGNKIENPRYLRKSEEILKEIQSKYSKHKGKTTKKKLSALHRKVTNQRNDFLHKESRMLVNKYGFIAYEDLNIKGMAQGRFSKSIHDAGWGKFIDMIRYKVESTGGYAIAVNPRNTSKKCSGCGEMVKKEIYQRQHDCPVCGLSLHRDHNASINILKSGTDLWNNQFISEAAIPLG
jgi:putative transposase